MRVTVTGPDQPGITSTLTAALGEQTPVLDLEQVVLRGHLTLGMLLQDPAPATIERLRQVADELGVTVETAEGVGDGPAKRTGRSVVTMVARPLLAGQVAEVTALLRNEGANIDRIRRLARGETTAVELRVSGAAVAGLRPGLARLAADSGCDIAVSPAGLARHGRRLVVMDVDSTLIQDEVIELIAAHAGTQDQVAAITAAAMRGELDFAQSLHERVATLAGLPVSILDDVRAAVRLTPGAETLVTTLKRLGFSVAVVSGGFLEVVAPLAEALGIDHARANRLEISAGRLTGRVSGPVVDRAGKAIALREFAAAEGLPLERTVAIGDGANDLDMLAAAGLGVAFNAKPTVAAQAHTTISGPRLDAVLYLLGLTRDEVEEAG